MIHIPYTPISFDPVKHKYTDDAGREYISVTTLLSRDEEFKAHDIASKCAINPRSKYYKMPVADIIAQWERSAPLGTELHAVIERCIKGEPLDDRNFAPIADQFKRLSFSGELLSEIRLHHEYYLIAGTADIIEFCGDCAWLWDIKTSVSRPNGVEMDSSKIHKYSLQLEIYKRLIEHRFNIPCKIGGIIWFKDYAKFREHSRLQIVQLEDVVSEVDDILHARSLEVLNAT